jgi:hypothetical protein
VDRAALTSAIDTWRDDDPHDTFRWSMVSLQHRYLWNIIPKVACVTTTITLREFEGIPHRGEELWDDPEVLHLRNFDTDEIADMLTSPDWCRFCFVRNPYDRLFSAYKSKIADPDGDPWYLPAQEEIREAFGYPARNGKRVGIVSFRDFVRFLQGGGWRYDNHWCVQAGKLKLDLIGYDFIGRFETFQRDFRDVLSNLGAPPDVVASAEKVHGQTAKICLPAAYDRDLADAVYDLYREDFETFAYDRDSWMFM